MFRIGLVAPGTRMSPDLAATGARRLARKTYGGRVELRVPSAVLPAGGPFRGRGSRADRGAGGGRQRSGRSMRCGWRAADMARAGWRSMRSRGSNAAARRKKWLGYSDAGFLLAGSARAGFDACGARADAGGSRSARMARGGARGLAWLVEGASAALEQGVTPGHPNLAFNLTILSQLLGTPLEPDFAGRVLMLEDVGEYMYRIDRYFFHVTSNAQCAAVRGDQAGAVFRRAEERSGLCADRGGGRAVLVRAVGHSLSRPRRYRPRQRQPGRAVRSDGLQAPSALGFSNRLAATLNTSGPRGDGSGCPAMARAGMPIAP